jgi:hypothetical protein
MRVNGVRLVAVNDNLDTINGEDDFTPFRNVLHISSLFKNPQDLFNTA